MPYGLNIEEINHYLKKEGEDLLLGILLGATTGFIVGMAAGGPLGGSIGFLGGAAGGLIIVSTYKLVKERAALAREKEQMEALFEKRRLELYIEAGIRKIKTIKSTIDMLVDLGVPLEKIKAHIKKQFPEDVFFEEDIRDPETHELLDDCVLAQDNHHYNRSTLIRRYQQALKEGTIPLCLKSSSGQLLNPATLSTDSVLQAKLKILRKAGLSAALATPRVIPTSRTPVSSTPSVDLVKTDQKQKFLLSSGEEYIGLFLPEKKPASRAPAQPLSFAERVSALKPEVDVIVRETVTQKIRMH